MIFHFYSKTGVFSILKKEDCNQLKKKRSDFDFSFLFCRLLLCVGPLDFFLNISTIDRWRRQQTNRKKEKKNLRTRQKLEPAVRQQQRFSLQCWHKQQRPSALVESRVNKTRKPIFFSSSYSSLFCWEKRIFLYIDFFSLCKYYFDYLYVETTLLRQSKNLYKLI